MDNIADSSYHKKDIFWYVEINSTYYNEFVYVFLIDKQVIISKNCRILFLWKNKNLIRSNSYNV